ncbi:MAG: nuclear transport factor 2 family protein [Acidobacteria bacterium]|nr:nuclear transport factor 2 family protein [Acidobacteriota bacterium]
MKKGNMKIYQIIIFALYSLFIFGCGTTQQTASPTETLKTYIEASDRKDIATIKQTFSKGTIKMYEDAAQKGQISVDEVIKGQLELTSDNKFSSNIESGEEKIEGDAASIEVKNKITGYSEVIPFVKEEGVWKIALDKFMQDMVEKQKQAMPAPTSSDSNNQAEESAANKK